VTVRYCTICLRVCSHISEHLQELKDAINVSAMSHEELEFHYFKCVYHVSLWTQN